MCVEGTFKEVYGKYGMYYTRRTILRKILGLEKIWEQHVCPHFILVWPIRMKTSGVFYLFRGPAMRSLLHGSWYGLVMPGGGRAGGRRKTLLLDM